LLVSKAAGGDCVYCHKCGAQNDDQAAFCDKCGAALQKQISETGPAAPAYPTPVQYAGFWRRLAAYLIDGLLLAVAWFAMLVVIRTTYLALTGQESEDLSDGARDTIVFLSRVAAAIVGWLYCAAMESSAKQATLGKIALGIVVTDMNGRRVSFGRATGRYFGRLLSGGMLGIGLIIIAFTEKKQGLHDIMADCLVVVKRRNHPQM
jgi:uncharacterized RDD family membrane protein YckC